MSKSFSELRARAAQAATNSGLCKCTLEPMGESGLEGYVFGNSYKFEHMDFDKNDKPYFRVYHYCGDNGWKYYETCSERTFHNHFQITEVTND